MTDEARSDVERPYMEVAEVELRLDGEFRSGESLERALVELAEAFDLTVFATEVHEFDPQGITGVAIVGDSHVAVHTWPECDYGHVEIFSCKALPGAAEIERRVADLGYDVIGVGKRTPTSDDLNVASG